MNPDDGFLFLSPSDIQKLQRYYQMLITTCHLQHLYEPEEILHQVLEKAREIVDSGQTIHNPYGWSRIVGKHIIFKGQREEIAQNKMCQKLITQFNDEVQQPLHQESIRDYYLSILRIALQELKQLSHEAYELLNLYFLQELSWEEVTIRLHPDTEIDKKLINRVRKAGCRAKEKLKQLVSQKLEDDTN